MLQKEKTKIGHRASNVMLMKFDYKKAEQALILVGFKILSIIDYLHLNL